jgi:hypothetical protein
MPAKVASLLKMTLSNFTFPKSHHGQGAIPLPSGPARLVVRPPSQGLAPKRLPGQATAFRIFRVSQSLDDEQADSAFLSRLASKEPTS